MPQEIQEGNQETERWDRQTCPGVPCRRICDNLNRMDGSKNDSRWFSDCDLPKALLHLLCAQAVYLHAAEPFQNHWSVDLELQIWLLDGELV